jgi:sugar-phosphatase
MIEVIKKSGDFLAELAGASVYQAAIFDMDGLIIDSEPLWRKAEIAVFGDYGISLTESMCASTMGLRLDEVVSHWREQTPDCNYDVEEVSGKIVDRMEELIRLGGTTMPGVLPAIELFKRLECSLAIASSSCMRLISAVVETLELGSSFDIIHSAEGEERGKPDPAVYISTSKLLNVAPEKCIALEDSLNGVIAAKQAGMTCIAVPDSMSPSAEIRDAADIMLTSLEELDEKLVTSSFLKG